MFEIGFWELVLIGVVTLLVVGPERLPGVARKAGQWIARARHIVATVKGEVERELRLEEMKQSMAQSGTVDQIRDLQQQIRTLESDLRSSVQSIEVPPAGVQQVAQDTNTPVPTESSAMPTGQLADANRVPSAMPEGHGRAVSADELKDKS